MKNFYVLTLFPEMIEGVLSHSIIGRAVKDGVINVECVNIRDFSTDKHRHVDDYPYGGGAGMVMQPQPIYDAYKSIEAVSYTHLGAQVHETFGGSRSALCV